MTSPSMRQRWDSIEQLQRFEECSRSATRTVKCSSRGVAVDTVPSTMELPGLLAVEVAAVAIALGRAKLGRQLGDAQVTSGPGLHKYLLLEYVGHSMRQMLSATEAKVVRAPIS